MSKKGHIPIVKVETNIASLPNVSIKSGAVCVKTENTGFAYKLVSDRVCRVCLTNQLSKVIFNRILIMTEDYAFALASEEGDVIFI